MKLKNLFKLGISVFAFFALVQSSFAISVSPAKTELDIDPGQTKTVTITVYNNTEKDMDNVVIETELFNRTDEQGNVIADDELLKNEKFNIVKWITFSDTGFPLDAKKYKEITATISVPEGAEPGGKYAEILFSQQPKEKILQGTGFTVISRVASLLLLTVSGDVIQSGEIERFELSAELKSDETIPFSVVFKNTGNVHVKPIGDIKIIDKDTGEELKNTGLRKELGTEKTTISKTIPINYDGSNVLLGSSRNFVSPWSQNYQNGEFTATATVEYGEEKKTAIKQLDFDIDESINIDKFDINILPTSSNFTLTITNTGNIVERFTGSISVTNFFKYEVGKIDIPADIEYIKPGETKTFTFDWIQTEMPRGLYTATLNAKLGLTQDDVTASVKFGHMTSTTYIIIGSLVLIILILLFLLFRKKKKEKKDKK